MRLVRGCRILQHQRADSPFRTLRVDLSPAFPGVVVHQLSQSLHFDDQHNGFNLPYRIAASVEGT